MTVTFERSEVMRLLDIDDAFIESLERESIIRFDIDGQRYSSVMFERVRVAHSLVFELEVNLSGVAVILRLRDEIGGMRGRLRHVEEVLSRHVADSAD